MKKPKVYKAGNKWRKNRYKFMTEYNIENEVKEFGKSDIIEKNNKTYGGETYGHLLVNNDSNQLHNFLYEEEILKEVHERFEKKAGDKHRVLTNTVASQVCCFNLFAPLKNRNKLANKVFSDIMNKEVQITDITIEYTPTPEESIGDQAAKSGTDADVGIFYTYSNNKKGVLLIEFKYIEAEFSVCSSYRRKKNIRSICDNDFYNGHIKSNIHSDNRSPDCGYLKYDNWELTKNSEVFDFKKIIQKGKCPFKFSLQQLWRNLLLAENIKNVKGLDEFSFWVLAPKENEFLWEDNDKQDVYDKMLDIMTDNGTDAFRKLNLCEFFRTITKYAKTEWEKKWLKKFEERYLTSTEWKEK